MQKFLNDNAIELLQRIWLMYFMAVLCRDFLLYKYSFRILILKSPLTYEDAVSSANKASNIQYTDKGQMQMRKIIR